ncbi:hypothetical protein Plhal304r1_c067g0155121 [Plasmopara halstedii]
MRRRCDTDIVNAEDKVSSVLSPLGRDVRFTAKNRRSLPRVMTPECKPEGQTDHADVMSPGTHVGRDFA